MTKRMDLGGSFTLPGTSMTLNRMGYGAMQLAGPGVWGPPRDVDGAIAVLREAVANGVNHLDTSDFYGPHVTNQIIKQALHPYPDDLVIGRDEPTISSDIEVRSISSRRANVSFRIRRNN
jgi:pyridoxine 4-dehydrogenase